MIQNEPIGIHPWDWNTDPGKFLWHFQARSKWIWDCQNPYPLPREKSLLAKWRQAPSRDRQTWETEGKGVLSTLNFPFFLCGLLSSLGVPANPHFWIMLSLSYVSVTWNEKHPDDIAGSLHSFSDGFSLMEVQSVTLESDRPRFK